MRCSVFSKISDEQSPEGIVFAGDSGNDYAALTAGFRAILVGNAHQELAERVAEHHRRGGHSDRLYLAREHATAGVLEGCRRFGLVQPDDVDDHANG